MQNFGRENFDDSTHTRQICQNFPPSKFYVIQYMSQVSSYFNITTSVIEDDVVGLTCLLCTSLRKPYYLIICVQPIFTYNYNTHLLYVCNNCNHIIVASVINVKSNKHNTTFL